MNVTLEEGPQHDTLHATNAIVLYEAAARVGPFGVREPNRSIAINHELAIDKDGRVTLAEGALVTDSLFTALIERVQARTMTYLPANVLAHTTQQMAWWTPASRRPMHFHTGDSATQRFDGVPIAHPPLVFVATSRSLCVWALRENERPHADTALYQAPYWNVYEDDRVCLGSMVLPKACSIESIDGYVNGFFGSEFTHLSSQGARWAHRGSYAEFLADCQKAERFDPQWLLASNMTISSSLSGK